MNIISDDLALALHLADQADQITTTRWQAADLRIESKSDATPVSDADTAVETALRETLAQQRSTDEIVGEEFGASALANLTGVGRHWVIDPIDGTKAFVQGLPGWASLIALVVDGTVRVGVVSAPALGQRWWAELGTGAYRQDGDTPAQRLSVSATDELARAVFGRSPLSNWSGRQQSFDALVTAVAAVEAHGDFLLHMLVAEGRLDAAAEPELSLWDIAALVPIVQEAGGRLTGFAGESWLQAGCAITTNAVLHEQVLAALHAK
ncbi:MAG TPA: histidinol-phosphatase [Actinobacteria bacterium]|nr:histidinol-phosphatase [Actinomycetota bacterium]